MKIPFLGENGNRVPSVFMQYLKMINQLSCYIKQSWIMKYLKNRYIKRFFTGCIVVFFYFFVLFLLFSVILLQKGIRPYIQYIHSYMVIRNLTQVSFVLGHPVLCTFLARLAV